LPGIFLILLIEMVLAGNIMSAGFTTITNLEELTLLFVSGTPAFQPVPTIQWCFLG
jgi:hypothetical protein